MKKLITLIIIILTLSVYSQNYPDIVSSEDWTFYQEADGVQQFYRIAQCVNSNESYYREYVLIKLINNTNQDKVVEWDNVFWYQDRCINCNMDNHQHHRVVKIDANSELSGNCEPGDKTLKIFSRFLDYKFDGSFLTHFELRNFNIK
jgi:hypothetical protein